MVCLMMLCLMASTLEYSVTVSWSQRLRCLLLDLVILRDKVLHAGLLLSTLSALPSSAPCIPSNLNPSCQSTLWSPHCSAISVQGWLEQKGSLLNRFLLGVPVLCSGGQEGHACSRWGGAAGWGSIHAVGWHYMATL